MARLFNLLIARLFSVLMLLSIWGAAGAAQDVDPNIQSRIDAFSPSVRDELAIRKPAPKPAPAPVEPVVKEGQPIVLTPEERENLFQAKRKEQGLPALETMRVLSPEEKEEQYKKAGVPKTLPGKPFVIYPAAALEKPKYPIYDVRISSTSGGSFETNASKTPVDPIDDAILSSSSIGVVKIEFDSETSLAMSLASTDVRYDQLQNKSFDSAKAAIGLTRVVNMNYALGQSGPLTRDTVAILFSASSTFTVGYQDHVIDLYSPAIGWLRENIGLTRDLCNDNYCYYADVSVGTASTWSDIDTQENSSMTIGATLGWRARKGLTLKANASVQGLHYWTVPGDRDDMVYRVGGAIEWAIADNVTLNAGAGYTNQDSNVVFANWNGWQASPQLKLVWELY